MEPNKKPIYPVKIKTAWNTAPITTGTTSVDGTGAAVDIMPAVGENGARVDQILVRPLGTNVATVMRFYLSNGLTNAVAANQTLVHEVTMPATTASQVAALAGMDVAIAKNEGEFACPIPVIPPGYKLFVTIGTAVASGFKVITTYGEY
jgi:hypothetical protein